MDKGIQINTRILKQCRTQMGLSLQQVKKKVPKIIEIEEALKEPTPKQLTKLAELYQVPRWVFLERKLPQEYHYDQTLTFRRFKRSEAFSLPNVRRLVSRVEQYRCLFLELRSEMNEPLRPFNTVTPSNSAEETADSVRLWLELDDPLEFDSLRQKLEAQNIFIFMTSKYNGWAKIKKDSFRGLSIFYETLPIIVVFIAPWNRDYPPSQLLKSLGKLHIGNTTSHHDNSIDKGNTCYSNKVYM